MHNVSQQLSCGANIVLVIGSGPQTTQPTTPDLFVLENEPENMNEGKSFAYLRDGVARFPDADFFLKVDMDTLMCPKAIVAILEGMKAAQQQWFGFKMSRETCGGYSHCPDHTWFYMSGGIYGLSFKLASQVVQSAWAQKHRRGYEDLMMGQMVFHVDPHPKYYHLACLYDVRGVHLVDSTTRCSAHHYTGQKHLALVSGNLCQHLDNNRTMPWVNQGSNRL